MNRIASAFLSLFFVGSVWIVLGAEAALLVGIVLVLAVYADHLFGTTLPHQQNHDTDTNTQKEIEHHADDDQGRR